MIQGVDYSSDYPSATGLAEVGKVFAGRYVGAGYGPKLLLPPEAKSLSEAGLKIVSLVEGASDGALGGWSMGVQHATQARQWHIDKGYPWPVPCYFAVDFDVTAAQWFTVKEYLQGAASVIGLPYTGIYGGLNAMKWAQGDDVARWFFQTYAWSGGVWDGGLHIEQYRNDVSLVGGTVDLCQAPQSEYGGWIMGTPAPVDPLQAQVDDNGWALNALTHLHTLTQGGRYKGVPIEITPLLTTMAASVEAIKAGLSTPIVPGTSTVDLTPVETALADLSSKVDAIESAVTVDAVAIGKAMTADPAFVAALAAAVAAQLAQIQLSITMSGSATGGVKPPTT